MSDESAITLEQWNEWRRHPVTHNLFLRLQAMRTDTLEAWSAGAFTGPTIDSTTQLNSRALGRIQTLEDILSLSYESLPPI